MTFSVERWNEGSLVRGTLRALAAPKRLIPIVAVLIALMVVQGSFSQDPLAIPLGLSMCLAFVLVAPLSWRILFPEGPDLSHGAIRFLLYATIGAGVVLTLGAAVPKILSMGDTFLTMRPSLIACAALFLVGGWGLGRDLQMEESLTREKARTAAAEREAAMAQLYALRTHLEPHFLFNTLNAIAEWCRQDPVTAERAVLQLSDLLRSVLTGIRAPTWKISQELDLLQTLFSLHRLRDPGLFHLEWRIAPDLPQVPIPPMLLLPLAENAVKHGPAAGHRGDIVLALDVEGSHLRVRMENAGAYQGPREGSSGLPTLEERLRLAYDGRALLQIAAVGDRTVAELRLPLYGPVAGVLT